MGRLENKVALATGASSGMAYEMPNSLQKKERQSLQSHGEKKD
jgi:NADP-dependent 3-hydroxy acid dehydrogenase YdfG